MDLLCQSMPLQRENGRLLSVSLQESGAWIWDSLKRDLRLWVLMNLIRQRRLHTWLIYAAIRYKYITSKA
jgi:hypothetical protein